MGFLAGTVVCVVAILLNACFLAANPGFFLASSDNEALPAASALVGLSQNVVSQYQQ
jgi:hypothetical protein